MTRLEANQVHVIAVWGGGAGRAPPTAMTAAMLSELVTRLTRLEIGMYPGQPRFPPAR
jgi:hypothetical protein